MAEVGIVLAVLPLVISTVEHYRDILRPFSRYRRFCSEAKKFQASILTQQTIYRNESVLLLCHAVSKAEAEEMIDDASHRLWRDAVVDQRVNKAIGQSADAVTFVVAQIENSLEEVSRLQARWGRILDVENDEENHADKRKWRKGISTKLKFAFSESSLEQKMKTLRRLTKDYQTLVNQAERNAFATRNSTQSMSARLPEKTLQRYEKIGATAKVLYNMLGDSCTKHTEHPMTISLTPAEPKQGNVRFELGFPAKVAKEATQDQPLWFAVESLMTTGGQADIRLVREDGHSGSGCSTPGPTIPISSPKKDRSTPPAQEHERKRHRSVKFAPVEVTLSVPLSRSETILPNLRAGKDFCTQVFKYHKTSAGEQPGGCIGILEDSNSCKHHVYLDRPALVRPGSKRESLNGLLKQIDTNEANVRLSQYGRLRFARILATAVLQFHTTPWLRNGLWRSGDISIFESGGQFDTILHKTQPFVDISVRGPQYPVSRSSSMQNRPYIQNKLLFGLALILLELAFQRPITDMQLPSDMVNGTDDLYVEYATAVRLSQIVSSELGSAYKNIVQKLLYCNFGTSFDLSDANLQQRYYTDIVCELHKLEDAFKQLQVD